MKEKTWLPGNISDRVRDLREEWGLTRKELAQRSGVDESLLGRIENNKIRKIQDDALTKLAKFFCVSTDFLLGLTDIPDRKNYDIEELGLSVQAARNLYTGAVNTQVVNLLLGDPRFAVLTNRIADFFDDTMAAGYAAQNQLYTSVSSLVGRIGKEKPEMKSAEKNTGKDPKYLNPIDDGTYYAVKEYDITRGEFGGLVTNDKAQVMTTEGEPIEGLYAAGLISSGDLLGDFYPGMEALGVDAYMGFIAGTEAAAHAASKTAEQAA